MFRGRAPTRAALLTTFVAMVAGGLDSAASAADPVKDPATIECPPAPSGWSLSAVDGKMVWDGERDARLAGNQQVAVNCNYVTSSDRHIQVTVAYALPSDPNPINDFTFGCNNGGFKWNETDRIFHVASQKQWALATFNDLLGQINGSEARAFESVTQQLLQNAEGYGHGCDLRVAPTELGTSFTFSFKVDAGHAQGSFRAQGVVSPKTNSAPIIKVSVPNFALSLTGVPRSLVLRVDHGIAYHPPSRTSARKVRLAVQVVTSKLAACRRGATGTLTVTAAPSVQLQICGKSFLQGKATAQIRQL